MKKTLSILAALSSLAVVTVSAQEDERFRPKEWEISPFATYVNKSGDDWGVGATAMYFVTKNIGVGGTTYWTDFGGTFFDNMAAEGQFRLPFMKSLAPYAVASVGYQFDSEEAFGTFGGGINFRPFDKIAAFSDIQYRIADKTRDGVFIRLGVRFDFF